jgi:hypothetical protein
VDTVNERVGIGIADPTQALDVSGYLNLGPSSGGGTYGVTFQSGRIDQGLFQINTGNDIYLSSLSELRVNIDSNTNETAAAFTVGHDGNGMTGGAELFRVQEDGSVGIGTAGPTGLLDVNNAASVLLATGADGRMVNVQGAFTEAASGTHARIAGVEIDPPAITDDLATVTNTASLYVSDAPSAVGATNYALWVDAGSARLDGTLAVDGTTTHTGHVILSPDLNEGLSGGGLVDCDTAGASKLLWDSATGKFSCGTDQDTGASTTTLQIAYNNASAPATITTGSNKDLVVSLADTATDSDFIVDMLGTGNVFEIQDGGITVLSVADGGAITVPNGATLAASGTGIVRATDLVAGASVVADTEVDDNLTIDNTGSVHWAALNNIPANLRLRRLQQSSVGRQRRGLRRARQHRHRGGRLRIGLGFGCHADRPDHESPAAA